MPQPPNSPPGREAAVPRWSTVLRSLREAAGVTQDGWAAWLGMSRATVQRWERGEAVPNVEGEAALVAACRDKGLFRTFAQGPLRGLAVTPDLLRDLLAEARLGASPRREEGSSAPAAPPASLPAPHTSFVGRGQEIDELLGLLPATRLLTLTGTGGIGKSRLAIEVGRRLRHRFPDGVWLVELAALTDPLHVIQAAASVLGVREEAGRPLLATLVDALRQRTALLLLDNCEHLMLACAGLAGTLRQECPQLTLLATSREALGIAGETAWRVPPLSLPQAAAGRPEPPAEVMALAQWDAVRLFVERASAARHGFTLTAETAPAVVEICRRLDGIPLAIELAAARVSVLAVEQIASRLDDRLRLLTGGGRDVLPRQQTLRAALDWSYDLLAAPEQAVLRRLAVFAGGASLDAAETVCAGGGIEPSAVLDLLAELVQKSLLYVEVQAGEARYRLLETVRQYAAQKLEAASPAETEGAPEARNEAAAVRGRHLAWYLALAVASEPELRGPGQARRLDLLEREHDNFRAALDWSRCAAGEAAAGVRMAAALRLFWFLRGYLSEGRRRIEAALAAAGDIPAEVRAQALDGAAALAHSQGDLAAARTMLEQSLPLWRGAGNRQGMAVSLNTLGIVLKSESELERAAAVFEEALALFREVGHTWGAATVLNNLAALALDRADYDAARRFGDEGLALKRQLGDRAGIVASLHNLGEVARYEGDWQRAATLLGESLALSRELGSTPRIAQTLQSLGLVAHEQGDAARAAALLGESLALFVQLDEKFGIALCLEGLAAVVGTAGDQARAARLFGAAEALREALGSPLPVADRPGHDRAVAAVRAALEPHAFAAAWSVGRGMTLEQAIAEGSGARR